MTPTTTKAENFLELLEKLARESVGDEEYDRQMREVDKAVEVLERERVVTVEQLFRRMTI